MKAIAFFFVLFFLFVVLAQSVEVAEIELEDVEEGESRELGHRKHHSAPSKKVRKTSIMSTETKLINS